MKKDILIDNKLIKKVLIITGISGLVIGLLIVALVSVNNFYKDHYLEFRSPLQSPIVVKDRQLPQNGEDLTIEEEKAEVSEVKEPRVTDIVSQNTLKLIEKNPSFTQRLIDEFESEWMYVAELLARESTWNSRAVNSTSGACGLFQSYPCEKMGCELGDVDCQIKWGKNYITQRYGTPEKALAFHTLKGWY